MTENGTPQGAPEPTQLQDIIAECILALEREGDDGVEAVLRRHPQLAERARSRMRGLSASGLLSRPAKDPARIGAYRIVQRLGSGGMGTVYLAEQQDALERRVAVKVIKPGMDTREVLARFALERQAMAMLDHPNIAKILDAGETDDGRPFLVMEYVSGMPITRYCDERRLPVHERIALFCVVCAAVQHAHHKGLIHRDLKPSNILVADRDGSPWPMVIDFGVAKSLGGRLGGQSLVTLRGHVLGTPEYMSPEQAANDMDVDTRADVFSLGVVLYELMTGTLPIESARLRGAGQSDLPRILRDSEIEAPSRRIARDTENGRSELRQSDSLRLRKRMRGDLDWITLRALERDRNRRYGMPGELAADLTRHLRNEPVLASPPSVLYRAQKFLARNRLQVASAAIVLGALLTGLVLSISASRSAEASARQSDRDFESALAAIERLVFFGDQRLVDEPQMDEVRRHLLQDALGFYQQVASGRSEDPRLQQRVAEASVRVGRIQQQLGDHAAALATLNQARARYDALQLVPPPVAIIAGIDLLRTRILVTLGKSKEAEDVVSVAAESLREVSTDPVQASVVARTRLQLLGQWARLLRGRDPQAALAAFEQALTIAQPWIDRAAGSPPELPAALHIAVQHAALLQELGDDKRALARASPLRTRLGEVWSKSAESERQQFVEPLNELGSLLLKVGSLDDAEDLLVKATKQYRWLCTTHPAQTSGPRALGIALCNLADVYMKQNQLDQADSTATESVQVMQAEFDRTPTPTLQMLLARTLVNYVRVQIAPRTFGAEVDAETVDKALQRAIDLCESLPSELRQEWQLRVSLASAWYMRAGNLQVRGDLEAALAAVQRANAEFTELAEQFPQHATLRQSVTQVRCSEAYLLAESQQWDRALAVANTVGVIDDHVSRIRMRAFAGLGNVDGVLAEVRRESNLEVDWIGSRAKAEALLQLATTLGDDARRPAILGEARALLRTALDRGQAQGGSRAMVAVMTAQTQELLVRIERADNDLAAATTAAAAVVAGYEPSFQTLDNEKNRTRLRRAGEVWLQLLLERRDSKALAAAIDHLAELFAKRGTELIELAQWSTKHAGMLPSGSADADATATRSIALLRAGLSLLDPDEGERTTLLAREAWLPLRAHPDFQALLAARK